MGAGASFPVTLNEEQAKQLAGDRFDKKGFQRLAKKQGGLISGYQMQMLFAQADAQQFGGYAEVRLKMAKELDTPAGMMSMFSSKHCKATLEYNGQIVGEFEARKETVEDGKTKALFDDEQVAKWWVQPGDPQEIKLTLKVGGAEAASATFKLFDFCNLNVGIWAGLDGGGGKANVEMWFAPKRTVTASKKDFTATKEKNLEEGTLGGILHLKILSAAGLAARDTKGMFSSEAVTSDPFVRISVDDDEIGVTPTVKKNLDPIWDFEIAAETDPGKHTLLLDVEDKDAGMLYDGEKSLGKVEMAMGSFANTVTEFAFPVKPTEAFEGATGTLTAAIFYAVKPSPIPKGQAMALGKLDADSMPVVWTPPAGKTLQPMPSVAVAAYQPLGAAIPTSGVTAQQMQSQTMLQQQMQQQMQFQTQMQQMQFEHQQQMQQMQARSQIRTGQSYRDYNGFRYYRSGGGGRMRRLNPETGEDEEVPDDEEDLPEDVDEIEEPAEEEVPAEEVREEEVPAEEAEEVDLYGACPQDLPDGGPSGGTGGGPAVPSMDYPLQSGPPMVHCHQRQRKKKEEEKASPRSLRIRELQATFDASAIVRARPLTVHAELRSPAPPTPCPKDMVTIVTQSSLDRLGNLEVMAATWTGPIVCALYAPPGEADVTVAAAAAAHARVMDCARGHRCSLDIYVVGEEQQQEEEEEEEGANGSGDESWRCAYPINRLRNVAVSRAVTDLIFNLDVDFVPSPGLHDRIVAAVSAATLATNKEKVAFVVPAVEITAGNVIESLDFSNGDLAAHRALRSAMEKGEASPFHVGHYPRGHLPTALNEAWFSASVPYEVDYVEGYEPYVVAPREQLPPFDARFRGYGLNKVIHAYAMAAAGFRFMVLPGVPPGPVAAMPVDAGCGFVAAAEHPKSAAWEKVYGTYRDPTFKDKVQALYNRAKLELDLGAAVTAKMKHTRIVSVCDKVKKPIVTPGKTRDVEWLTIEVMEDDTCKKLDSDGANAANTLCMTHAALVMVIFVTILIMLMAFSDDASQSSKLFLPESTWELSHGTTMMGQSAQPHRLRGTHKI